MFCIVRVFMAVKLAVAQVFYRVATCTYPHIGLLNFNFLVVNVGYAFGYIYFNAWCRRYIAMER